jgi:hypothetical protein
LLTDEPTLEPSLEDPTLSPFNNTISLKYIDSAKNSKHVNKILLYCLLLAFLFFTCTMACVLFYTCCRCAPIPLFKKKKKEKEQDEMKAEVTNEKYLFENIYQDNQIIFYNNEKSKK